MRAVILSLALALGLAAPVASQNRDAAITDVIQSQIEAFLADDFETAFSFASPGIKQFFRTPDRFGFMVRRGYPMVWRPGEVTYLEQEPRDGAVHQLVRITDQDGVTHVLDYQMIPSPDGWQINGVEILRAPDIGA